MDALEFSEMLEGLGDAFYTGVPDSLLAPFIDAVMEKYGVSDKHIVAANEGAAVGLAAGHYLATSRPAIVYMQNSGIGNAINPICSLLHKKVYSIPVIFVIGWRGELGIMDEPQHVFQGEVTLPLLDCLEIPYVVVSESSEGMEAIVKDFKKHIENGQSVAFVIPKGALTNARKVKYENDAILSREDALKSIFRVTGDEKRAVFICTTGKLSREVFELREQSGEGHGQDFLTVGSMGHSSMIAYSVALAKPERRVYCLDGDGATLMHMGSMAIVGARRPDNLVHIVINNGAHETVGGLPAVSGGLELHKIAHTLGYLKTFRVWTQCELENVLLEEANVSGTVFIEVMCNLKSRVDLGRPTTSPIQNKLDLIKNLGD